MPDDDKKIIIDEDWKAQVQREREQVRQSVEDGSEDGEGEEESAEPPSLFLALVETLAAQAMYALGVIGPPDTKQVYIDLGQAKYLVDTLQMLREKTAGNLDEDETGHLTEVLAELQRVYVVRAQQVQEAAMRQGMPNKPDVPLA